MADEHPAPNEVLWHQSGVNAKGEPFVQLLLGERVIAQLDPEMARDHGAAILEAAEAAEQDAFLLAYLTRPESGINVTLDQAAGILVYYRQWRRERGKRHTGPTSAREFVQNPPAPKGDPT